MCRVGGRSGTLGQDCELIPPLGTPASAHSPHRACRCPRSRQPTRCAQASPAIWAIRSDKLSRVGSEQEGCDVCTALIDHRVEKVSDGQISKSCDARRRQASSRRRFPATTSGHWQQITARPASGQADRCSSCEATKASAPAAATILRSLRPDMTVSRWLPLGFSIRRRTSRVRQRELCNHKVRAAGLDSEERLRRRLILSEQPCVSAPARCSTADQTCPAPPSSRAR